MLRQESRILPDLVLDWPLSREEKKSCVLRFYEQELCTMEGLLEQEKRHIRQLRRHHGERTPDKEFSLFSPGRPLLHRQVGNCSAHSTGSAPVFSQTESPEAIMEVLRVRQRLCIEALEAARAQNAFEQAKAEDSEQPEPECKMESPKTSEAWPAATLLATPARSSPRRSRPLATPQQEAEAEKVFETGQRQTLQLAAESEASQQQPRYGSPVHAGSRRRSLSEGSSPSRNRAAAAAASAAKAAADAASAANAAAATAVALVAALGLSVENSLALTNLKPQERDMYQVWLAAKQLRTLEAARAPWDSQVALKYAKWYLVRLVAALQHAAVLGAGGAAAGLVTGTTVGAACGAIPAVLTLGLSIPIGAALGGAAGLCTGTTCGSVVGFMHGAVSG